MVPVSEAPASLEFGRFRILPQRREVLADGQPMELGGRAFDVLVVLIEAQGAVVSKADLMSRVWPDRIVEENNLHAQVKALRRAFSDHDLIRTVVGRVYQFRGEVRAYPAGESEQADSATARDPPRSPRAPTNLPAPTSDLIGRDAEIVEVIGLVADHRFVTLTGTGGIGKTRLAFEVARHLLPQFADGVWIAELASLSDPQLVPITVASTIGLELVSGVVSPERIAAALGSKRIMLVLDNCEHVIDAAAEMVEAFLHANPAARVIATSREPLRAESEHLYRVPPLAVPAEDMQALEDLLHGAVALFVAARRRRTRTSRRISKPLPPWRPSVDGSTASRWPLNWRQHAPRRLGCKSSLPGSTTVSAFLPRVAAQHCGGIKLCGQRSIGATNCCQSTSVWYCGGCRSFPLILHWKRQLRSQRTPTYLHRRSSNVSRTW